MNHADLVAECIFSIKGNKAAFRKLIKILGKKHDYDTHKVTLELANYLIDQYSGYFPDFTKWYSASNVIVEELYC